MAPLVHDMIFIFYILKTSIFSKISKIIKVTERGGMKRIILFYESLNKFQNKPILLNGTLSEFNFSLIIEGAAEKE